MQNLELSFWGSLLFGMSSVFWISKTSSFDSEGFYLVLAIHSSFRPSADSGLFLRKKKIQTPENLSSSLHFYLHLVAL